jgi:hypothetical protein
MERGPACGRREGLRPRCTPKRTHAANKLPRLGALQPAACPAGLTPSVVALEQGHVGGLFVEADLWGAGAWWGAAG